MIAVRHTATGEIQFVASSNGHAAEWAQYGPALPTGLAPERAVYQGGAWVEDIARVERELIDAVKAEAERRKMTSLSSGGAKKTEYAVKAAEVRAWNSLAGTASNILIAFNLMSAGQRGAIFAYAIADAVAHGDTVANAIARFQAGMSKSNEPAIAAVEAKACEAIRAKTSAAAKRSAAAAVGWPA